MLSSCSGGDCGNMYIWCKKSGELLLKVPAHCAEIAPFGATSDSLRGGCSQARADGSIVNCVAPHPTEPILAVSGIDSNVKVFAPGDVREPKLAKEGVRRRTADSENGGGSSGAGEAFVCIRNNSPISVCLPGRATISYFLRRNVTNEARNSDRGREILPTH